jgi:hypothetical protein
LPLVDDFYFHSHSLLLFSKNRSIFKWTYEKNILHKLHLTWSQQYSVNTFSGNGHLQRLPQIVTKWFVPAPLDVKSYDTELKMEIKWWKLSNISRRLCEEVVAPKGTKVHTLGTTSVHFMFWKTQRRLLHLSPSSPFCFFFCSTKLLAIPTMLNSQKMSVTGSVFLYWFF